MDTEIIVEDEPGELGIALLPIRKKNSKRPHPPVLSAWISAQRKGVETAGSLTNTDCPRAFMP